MTVHEREPAHGTAGAPAALVSRRDPGTTPRAAVLFLHGGTDESRSPCRPWQPAALRMRPFVRAVASALPAGGAGVFLGEVRYRVRGWNGPDEDALRDAHRALEELALRAGDVPVVLVGHSMGGRAALRAAAAPQVRAVLALAPWCPEGEPVTHLRDKEVVVLHGDHDRVTDPRASVTYVTRAQEAGSQATIHLVPGGDHAMLHGARNWHRTAASTTAALLGL
ncbi:alpha/beta hydrolase [Streptomyces geranii]|uniref:alpha/beta hydrolase n=1 Tax=Streptomyces geranii TaxID=2058923 RepID=UPI000D0414E0|nr:alpha/beta fold hydrolase [Streptomyces geranii]